MHYGPLDATEAPPLRRPSRLVLVGHPVAHSLSPTFQNAALGAAGLGVRYEAVDVVPADLPAVLTEFRASRVAGNATVPHKAAVRSACDRLTASAHDVGAVNTFWCADDGALVGDNTDVAGAAAAIRVVAPAIAHGAPARVALLGAGGAAAALIAAVRAVSPQSTLAVWARGATRAAALAERFGDVVAVARTIDDALGAADLVVNATPRGLSPADELPCPIAAIPPSAAVLDLVYGPDETAWVRAARASGLPVHDGLVMLVEQGAAAFARWFGVEPDRASMWAAVRARTGRVPPAETARW
ncbi:MAG TPA: shikimate dehydrogenase [Gemmatirosa sp.]